MALTDAPHPAARPDAGRFATDTAVTSLGQGRWEARMDRGWWVQRGPNGGYIAAVVARAILAEVGDPDRTLRSLTLHYLRPPAEGPCTVDVTVERAGRGLTTVTARMAQDGTLMVLATAACAGARDGVAFADLPMPAVPGPDELEPRPSPPDAIPMNGRWAYRPVAGVPDGTSEHAESTGWIRLAGDEPTDVLVLAAMTDAWYPAVFTLVAEPLAVPTIDLTVHVRRPPAPGTDWCLVRFRSTLAADGYLEEDGTVWAPDGTVLAQSRQLALAAPIS